MSQIRLLTISICCCKIAFGKEVIRLKLWVVFIILYGIFKGLREPIKKKALEKSGVLETLFMYTFIGFLMSVFSARDIFSLSFDCYLIIFVKSLVIFVAWIATFKSVKALPVSLYGVIDMSRVLFSTLFGVLLLGENITVKGSISLVLVMLGLYLVNLKGNSSNEDYNVKYIWVTIFSCALNAVSGTIDKFIMSEYTISSPQLQFWFMFMLSMMYFLYIVLKREKVDVKGCLTNPGIYAISFLLVLGDRLLFVANADPESKVTIMTLLKQSSAIVTIIAGKVIYKEKNILFKMFCAGIIIFGIVLSVL